MSGNKYLQPIIHMKKVVWSICLIFITFSCEKEADRVSIADLVKQTQYYQNEIFSIQNQKIYGQWELLYMQGGLMGSKIMPTSDCVIEFVPYGIYGKIKDDEIIETGKIRIIKQDNKLTVVDFFADEKYKTDYFLIQQSVNFRGQDTLILYDYNVGDGYGSYYKRIK